LPAGQRRPTCSIRLPFAGHPLVGVSWLLRARLGTCDVVQFSWVAGRADCTRGVGSEIRTRPHPDGRIAVGGRVTQVEEPRTGS
jgi:hypothetical protein